MFDIQGSAVVVIDVIYSCSMSEPGYKSDTRQILESNKETASTKELSLKSRDSRTGKSLNFLDDRCIKVRNSTL